MKKGEIQYDKLITAIIVIVVIIIVIGAMLQLGLLGKLRLLLPSWKAETDDRDITSGADLVVNARDCPIVVGRLVASKTDFTDAKVRFCSPINSPYCGYEIETNLQFKGKTNGKGVPANGQIEAIVGVLTDPDTPFVDEPVASIQTSNDKTMIFISQNNWMNYAQPDYISYMKAFDGAYFFSGNYICRENPISLSEEESQSSTFSQEDNLFLCLNWQVDFRLRYNPIKINWEYGSKYKKVITYWRDVSIDNPNFKKEVFGFTNLLVGRNEKNGLALIKETIYNSKQTDDFGEKPVVEGYITEFDSLFERPDANSYSLWGIIRNNGAETRLYRLNGEDKFEYYNLLDIRTCRTEGAKPLCRELLDGNVRVGIIYIDKIIINKNYVSNKGPGFTLNDALIVGNEIWVKK